MGDGVGSPSPTPCWFSAPCLPKPPSKQHCLNVIIDPAPIYDNIYPIEDCFLSLVS